ncbi:hypothetical protein IEQ34_008230 [Dendrobium chrysotoxum]|uniref:Uncharacterized protein n=1 Tax=Dendrobium chrysotoxum TaxID=161865 RepID=A0AAV7H6N3_DENCH|nr:hypothetical protein IEQ34_008230 [Dendrobium chrysotoxum]
MKSRLESIAIRFSIIGRIEMLSNMSDIRYRIPSKATALFSSYPHPLSSSIPVSPSSDISKGRPQILRAPSRCSVLVTQGARIWLSSGGATD